MKIESFEIVGFLAAAATATAFFCRDMPKPRMIAIAADVLFLVYGFGFSLLPVIAPQRVRHALNGARLAGCLRRPVELEVGADGKTRGTP